MYLNCVLTSEAQFDATELGTYMLIHRCIALSTENRHTLKREMEISSLQSNPPGAPKSECSGSEPLFSSPISSFALFSTHNRRATHPASYLGDCSAKDANTSNDQAPFQLIYSLRHIILLYRPPPSPSQASQQHWQHPSEHPPLPLHD